MNKILRAGFTMIEIMIAVSIIVVLAAIAIPNFIAYRTSSHIGVCKSNIAMIKRSCDACYLHTGHAVTDLSLLCQKTAGVSYMRSVPTCPIGGKYSVSFDQSDEQFHVTCSAFDEETHNVGDGSGK